MHDLVHRQLAQSVTTMTAVLNDHTIHEAVVEAGKLTADSMKHGGKLMVCGNGGSAADAQHLVAEFVSRLTVDRPALRAVALTTDTSILTAIGNDYHYDNVFERQVEAIGNRGDVLLAISTSGNSKNCVKALQLAREMHIHTVSYTGNGGGAMKTLSDINVIIPSTVTMNIQESHLALEHIYCMCVERFYFGMDFDKKPQHLANRMTPTTLLALLADVQRGSLLPAEAAARLANLPFEDFGEARIDHHRTLRTGLPEVIYAAGKTPEQVANIFLRMAITGTDVLATRATPEAAEAVHTLLPAAKYHAQSRTITLRQSQQSETKGHIAVVCAGTSDLPIAEEAAITAELFNTRVTRLYDVGVAGIHRLLAVRPQLAAADAIIVCAGMEGALPSVVGGLVGVPVLAVPTSVGYGASFAGAAALLGMLNSCSPNVSVVNIDNGFGAAYSATLIARAAHVASNP